MDWNTHAPVLTDRYGHNLFSLAHELLRSGKDRGRGPGRDRQWQARPMGQATGRFNDPEPTTGFDDDNRENTRQLGFDRDQKSLTNRARSAIMRRMLGTSLMIIRVFLKVEMKG